MSIRYEIETKAKQDPAGFWSYYSRVSQELIARTLDILREDYPSREYRVVKIKEERQVLEA